MHNPDKKRLQGQTAIITGAGTGIGKAIAIRMAGEGAKVVINFIVDEDITQEVVDIIKNAGGEAIRIRADVSNEDEVREMFRKTIETFGTIPIMLHPKVE